ncbi:MAG: hypothetical protein ABFS38_12260 [Bacteroidota bacterium]
MKKFYLLFVGVMLSAMTFAQIPTGWWSYLPNDFLDNPYERMTVQVRQVDDAYVADAASLESLWGVINDVFKNPLDAWTNTQVTDVQPDWSAVTVDVPAQAAEGYEGHFALLASSNYLALVCKVSDDEVDFESGDGFELAIAPYGDAYDPGRTIYPDTAAAEYDADSSMYMWGAWDGWYNAIHPDTLTMMAQYGLWGETGAAKFALVPENSDAYYAAKNMVFDDIRNFGDTLDTSPGAATSTVPFITMVEPFSEGSGYYYLCAMPWQMFTNDFVLDQEGETMSLAVQGRDFDSDNIKYTDWSMTEVDYVYTYWGGTDDNSAFWATAFYGAKAELVVPVGFNEKAAETLGAYYANNRLFLEQTVASMEIYSVTGSHVRSMSHVSGTVDLNDLENGLYIATMKDEQGALGTLKFVKY